jgi:hypothetical protein
MTQTKVVAILGGTVLIAALALWLLVKGGEHPKATPAAPVDHVTAGSATPPPVAPALPGRDQPVVAATDTPRAPDEEPVATYEVGGRTVHDHRKGEHAPVEIPPAVHPAEARRIPPSLTQEVAQKLRVKVGACGAAIPADARGEKPRVAGLMTIAIKDKQLTVSTATMKITGITGAAADAAKQCVEAGALAVTHTTTEADLPSYDINVSFAL